ncbi:hypothetical protein V6N13_067012 [Hibiscus sabdariffa]
MGNPRKYQLDNRDLFLESSSSLISMSACIDIDISYHVAMSGYALVASEDYDTRQLEVDGCDTNLLHGF